MPGPRRPARRQPGGLHVPPHEARRLRVFTEAAPLPGQAEVVLAGDAEERVAGVGGARVLREGCLIKFSCFLEFFDVVVTVLELVVGSLGEIC